MCGVLVGQCVGWIDVGGIAAEDVEIYAALVTLLLVGVSKPARCVRPDKVKSCLLIPG